MIGYCTIPHLGSQISHLDLDPSFLFPWQSHVYISLDVCICIALLLYYGIFPLVVENSSCFPLLKSVLLLSFVNRAHHPPHPLPPIFPFCILSLPVQCYHVHCFLSPHSQRQTLLMLSRTTRPLWSLSGKDTLPTRLASSSTTTTMTSASSSASVSGGREPRESSGGRNE